MALISMMEIRLITRVFSLFVALTIQFTVFTCIQCNTFAQEDMPSVQDIEQRIYAFEEGRALEFFQAGRPLEPDLVPHLTEGAYLYVFVENEMRRQIILVPEAAPTFNESQKRFWGLQAHPYSQASIRISHRSLIPSLDLPPEDIEHAVKSAGTLYLYQKPNTQKWILTDITDESGTFKRNGKLFMNELVATIRNQSGKSINVNHTSPHFVRDHDLFFSLRTGHGPKIAYAILSYIFKDHPEVKQLIETTQHINEQLRYTFWNVDSLHGISNEVVELIQTLGFPPSLLSKPYEDPKKPIEEVINDIHRLVHVRNGSGTGALAVSVLLLGLQAKDPEVIRLESRTARSLIGDANIGQTLNEFTFRRLLDPTEYGDSLFHADEASLSGPKKALKHFLESVKAYTESYLKNPRHQAFLSAFPKQLVAFSPERYAMWAGIASYLIEHGLPEPLKEALYEHIDTLERGRLRQRFNQLKEQIMHLGFLTKTLQRDSLKEIIRNHFPSCNPIFID